MLRERLFLNFFQFFLLTVMAAPASALGSGVQNAERRPSRSSAPHLGVKIPFERKATPNPVTTGTKHEYFTSTFFQLLRTLQANCCQLSIVSKLLRPLSFRQNCLVSSQTTSICSSLLTSRSRSTLRSETLKQITSKRLLLLEFTDAHRNSSGP